MKNLFKSIYGFAILVALTLCLPYSSLAQGFGTVNGTVVDSAGAAISSATVVLTQQSTGITQTVKTNNAGFYVFPSVSPSNYSLAVAVKGFKRYEKVGIQLQADQNVTANVNMVIGSAETTVNVQASAVTVDTVSGTLSQVVGQSEVNTLPLNGRNAAALSTLVAGVSIAPNAQADQGATKTFPVVIPITANGTRVGQTNYLLDGGNNVDEYTNVNAPFPMPDALQEFSVQTSNYNAEYGQNAGGVVNIITRSGSNRFHGDLFEYLRNRVFNAANYFSYVNGVKTVDPLKRNQFGGTIGGPVWIPGLYNGKDKTFFFFGYQKTIQHTASTSATAATLPTTAQLAGTFTEAAGTCITNPLQPTHIYPCVTSGSSSVTTVTTTDYSSVSRALLTYLPSGGASGSFTYVKPNFTALGEVTARVDQNLSSKDKAALRYFSDSYHLNGVLNLSNLLTYQDQADIRDYNALFSETHTFNDHLLNNFVLDYQLLDASRGPIPGSISVADLGVNIWQPAFKQINSIAVSGGFTVGDNPQGFFRRANYTLTNDVHWQRGNHSMAFGLHFELSKVDVDNLFRQPGNFTFNANNTGDAQASFLFGYVQDFTQASGQFLNLRGKFTGLYAQDTWKASRRLSLNYGIRWEPFEPWHEKEGRMGSFNPNLEAAGVHSIVYPNLPAGLVVAGDPGFNANGVPSIFTHFMPRAGFAYDVSGNGKTIVRGGGGMFFDSRLSSVFFNIYSNSSPFITNVDLNNTTGAKITFADPYGSYGTPNPFPAPQPPLSTSAIPVQGYLTYDPFNSFKTPVTFSYNLTVERQVTPSLLGRAAYVGSHSSHQWVPMELNPVLPSGNRQYNPVYTNTITEFNMGGNGSYNSLQLTLEQRMHWGLTVTGNYTWSKALDNLPQNAAATSIGAGNSYVYPIYLPNFKSLDQGPSDFDHRNILTLSYVYNTPKVNAFGNVVDYVLNSWQTTGLFRFSSGDPLTVYASNNNHSASGQSRDRAVQSGAAYGTTVAAGGTACGPAKRCKQYLNGTSFANSAVAGGPLNPLAYGTVKKGAFVGPQYADWDMSIARTFPVYARATLQFRAEYFNVLNHTNFGAPSTTVGTSLGQITGTTPQNSGIPNDPRIAQLSLKLAF